MITGSSTLSENYGLQDQAMALAWVQENIALFKGDPTRVTLGADRNGADIASLHLSSSSSFTLFQQALLMVSAQIMRRIHKRRIKYKNTDSVSIFGNRQCKTM